MTTLTPPEPTAPLGAGQPTPPEPARRTSSRLIAILAICAGAALLMGTIVTGVFSIVRSVTTHTGTVTASASGLRGISLDVDAAKVTVEYADVDEATLRVSGGSGADDWTFSREGDLLVVASDRDWWGRWGWFREGDTATVTLPTAASGADADFSLNGGSLRARGDFGDVDLELNAGSISVNGTAASLRSDVNAGSITVDLAGVADASLTVNAGSFDGRLRESAPSTVVVDVSAGRLELTLPDAVYAVTSDVSAGSFTHDLETASTASNRLDVRLSAGTVIVRGD